MERNVTWAKLIELAREEQAQATQSDRASQPDRGPGRARTRAEMPARGRNQDANPRPLFATFEAYKNAIDARASEVATFETLRYLWDETADFIRFSCDEVSRSSNQLAQIRLMETSELIQQEMHGRIKRLARRDSGITEETTSIQIEQQRRQY